MYRHRKEYEIRYTDVDFADTLKLSSLLSMMEESACLSADELGFGYSVLQPKNIGFILANWYIKLFKPVKLGDKLTIYTWPVPPKKLIVLRDFELYVNGEKVGVATSRWCLVDLGTFRMLPSSTAFDEHMQYNDSRSVENVNFKIAQCGALSHSYSKIVSYSDYDHYNHANNTKYADFLMDAFYVEELENMCISSVGINYIKQCKCGEVLKIYKQKVSDDSFTVEGRVDGDLRVQMYVEFNKFDYGFGNSGEDKPKSSENKYTLDGKVQFTVKRAKRRSISMRILENNSIIVSCPINTTDKEIEDFLRLKRKWIEQHLAVNKLKNEFLSDVIAYRKILVKGKSVPFELNANAEESFSYSAVSVSSLKKLKKLYVNNLGGQFMQMVDLVCSQAGLSYGKISFRDLKSRWGSCNANGDIVFNYKILMLSEEFWLYVIVHELCHTVHMDHSKEFYKLVAKIMPEFKSVSGDLKLYSRITKLY